MATHEATATVAAPAARVYELFSHFNDFPKYMSYVKEVTYVDDERTHWVVDILGRREWTAVNDNWIPERRIGWRSVDGLQHSGCVTFVPDGDERTTVHVEIAYEPPGGKLGALGEALGGGAEFDRRLHHELQHFAIMVCGAPHDAVDPTASSYLFHDDSAAARGETTPAQDATMEDVVTGANS